MADRNMKAHRKFEAQLSTVTHLLDTDKRFTLEFAPRFFDSKSGAYIDASFSAFHGHKTLDPPALFSTLYVTSAYS